jgi:hypothetical protein
MELRLELILPVAIAVGVLFEKARDLRAARRARRPWPAAARSEPTSAREHMGYERRAA